MRRFNNPLSMIPCSECDIGQMRQTTVTYFTFVGSRMITVPDFPAWICDMCGKCEYDLASLDNLALLLCPKDANLPTKHRSRPAAKRKPAVSEAPSSSSN